MSGTRGGFRISQGPPRRAAAALSGGTRTRCDAARAVAPVLAVVLAVALSNVPAAADEPPGLGQRSQRDVTLADQLSFREQQVREEMSELEQRMFRLSESLKQLEPENSSRLIIGLKYAREELILHQMQAIGQALAAARLKGAVAEQKQLMAKLERLQQLLLSTDLDFEMRLERLRQLRAALRRLDTVIREESRQEKLASQAASTEKRLAELIRRQATLEDLVRRQREHVEQIAPLADKPEPDDANGAALGRLSRLQESTRADTKALAAELQDGASPPNLVRAAGRMQTAVAALDKPAAAEAQPEAQQALVDLERELASLTKERAAAEAALAQDRFERMRGEQQANRVANDEVGDMTRQLGSSGTTALAELLRAGAGMSAAEEAFARRQAGGGHVEQSKALAALRFARELLAEEAERLARQLRGEVKKRVMDGLANMLDAQTAVRQRTETLAATERSRQALAALTELAAREERIADTAQELINVVEETEFGIALPAALAAVRDAVQNVALALAAGDASSEVVAAEERIEADLKAILDVVSEMSDANSRRGNRGGGSPQDQRRELNRILSELRMLRLLEERVRQDTRRVDDRRPMGEPLSADLRRQAEQLAGRQADIREAAELLAVERADELPDVE